MARTKLHARNEIARSIQKGEDAARRALSGMDDSQLIKPEVELQDEFFEFYLPWHENNEKVFIHTLSSDIFDAIMLFIPAYPYYFSLVRVNKKWNKELQQKIYPQVTHLDLLNRLSWSEQQRWKSFYEVAGYKKQYPFAFTNITEEVPGNMFKVYREVKLESLTRIWSFLVKCFPNVTHIKMRTYTSVSANAAMVIFLQIWKLKSLRFYLGEPPYSV